MVSISIEYDGELRCKAIHDPSGNALITDAPIDNNGKGASFSPTDLLATALGTCIMTIMGIAAEKRSIDIKGTIVRVNKIMISEPIRRIGRLEITIILPSKHYSEGDMAAFHHAAKTCPVMMSINPEIDVQYSLNVAEQ
jgi:putative redox protein